MATLEDRVSALEARISPQGEAVQATYITVNPTTGAVSAQFTGSVLLSEAAAAPLNASNALAWQDAAGTIRDFVQANGAGALHALFLECFPDATDEARLSLGASVAGAAGSALIQARCQDSTGVFHQVTVLDSNGASGFLQNATAVAATPAIVMGTPRQPNTLRPTLVVLVIDTVAAGGFARLLMDSGNPPLTAIAQFFDSVGRSVIPVTFIVPAANWYETTIGGGAPIVLTSFEWTL